MGWSLRPLPPVKPGPAQLHIPASVQAPFRRCPAIHARAPVNRHGHFGVATIMGGTAIESGPPVL